MRYMHITSYALMIVFSHHVSAESEQQNPSSVLLRLVELIKIAIATGTNAIILIGFILCIIALLLYLSANKRNIPLTYPSVLLGVGFLLVSPVTCSDMSSRTIIDSENQMYERLESKQSTPSNVIDMNGE